VRVVQLRRAARGRPRRALLRLLARARLLRGGGVPRGAGPRAHPPALVRQGQPPARRGRDRLRRVGGWDRGERAPPRHAGGARAPVAAGAGGAREHPGARLPPRPARAPHAGGAARRRRHRGERRAVRGSGGLRRGLAGHVGGPVGRGGRSAAGRRDRGDGRQGGSQRAGHPAHHPRAQGRGHRRGRVLPGRRAARRADGAAAAQPAPLPREPGGLSPRDGPREAAGGVLLSCRRPFGGMLGPAG